MYRDVTFVVTDTPSDENALEAAVAFCRAHDARLRVSIVLHLPIVATAYGLTPVVIDESYSGLREAAQGLQAKLRKKLEAAGVAFEVTLLETQLYSAKQIQAALARYADIVFVAAPGTPHSDSGVLHGIFATLLNGGGRPAIAVSRDARFHFPAKVVVVGWSPTPEASRAVHDALPLLRAAERVDVVVVEPETGEQLHGQEPGADIAAHLARHGVKVSASPARFARGTVGTHLLVSAEESRADLVVAGAYGHSRAREWAFGGTTRELLDRSSVPVLFSH